jgi:hypothetical protein
MGDRYLLPRSGVSFDILLARQLLPVRSFLESNTRPGDYVYFFPNEAAYYFLFDRRNPTRYAIAYFAATRSQRQEMIADLEQHRPEYVVYSLTPWRVDDIPEEQQVPELVAYLRQRYELRQDLGDTLILQRRH